MRCVDRRDENAFRGVGALVAAAVATLLCITPLFADEVSSIEIFGLTQGTSYSVKAFGLPDEIGKAELQRLVQAELSLIDSQLSNWNPDSEISRFNAHQGTDWFPVTEATCAVVTAGLEASQKSDGAFDMTVGPLVDLWGFGVEPSGKDLPTEDEIEKARKLVGWMNIEVRQSPPAIRKRINGVRLDLAGIAQGFSVDRLGTIFKQAGASSFLVEIGGEEVAIGLKPDGSPWRIGIERPHDSPLARNGLQTVIPLKDQAIATSGDYRRFRRIDGLRYSHTIDPRTGRPITHNLASVTVLGETCGKADAISTTLMVLGPEHGIRWAIENDIAAMFVVRQADGFTVGETPAFAKMKSLSGNEPQRRKDRNGELSEKPESNGLSIWHAIVLGIVEGATEYLPVSSTGHLVIVQRALGLGSKAEEMEAANALAICIQLGAILAVLVLYFRRFQQMFRGLCGRDADGVLLLRNLLVAFFPAAIVGLIFHDWIKQHFFGVRPVAGALFVGGLLILATARGIKNQCSDEGKQLHQITLRDALLIGIMQCLAFWPGFSRSLATILGSLWTGLTLKAAVEFSFLLGLVTLSAATVFEGMQHGSEIVTHYGVVAPSVALFVAFVSAVFSVRFMIRVLSSHGLAPFGYYRIVLAIACLMWM